MIQLLIYMFFSLSAPVKTNNFLLQNSIHSTQQFDTLHILISQANNIFYYNGELQADASNFKSATVKNIKDWIEYSQNESNDQKHQLQIILKVQNASTLSESSKKIIDFICKQPCYKQIKLNEVEMELIRITEDVMK